MVMTYADLQQALLIFGLGERATLKDIKSRYRNLAKRYHPDTSTSEEADAMRKVNAAYRIIQAYIAEYRFSFTEDEFYEQNPEERLYKQFEGFMWW